MNDSDTPLRETLAAWLREQGHEAAISAQDERYGVVSFRARGLRFSVRVDEHDPGFSYILFTTDIPDDIVDELIARRAAGLVESRTKVVKVEVRWDSRTLALSAEQLVAEPCGAAIFWRTITLLVESFRRLRQTFDEEAGRDAAARFTNEIEAEFAAEMMSEIPSAEDPAAAPEAPNAMEDAR